MREIKAERIREAIRHVAAEFLSEVSNRTSLITVTDVYLSPRADRAEVRITVLPEEKEAEALEFARRSASALRATVAKKVAMQRLPFFSFVIDRGEKNRQKLDTLTQI